MKPLSHTIEKFSESVFATLTRKARQHKAINIAQGFPDFDGPQWVIELLKESIKKEYNQYAPLEGIAPLRHIVAKNFKHYQNMEYDSNSEITITHGATEAIFCTIMATVNPGDEVILFEPFYDSYLAAIQLAGGTPVPVTLHAPDFRFVTEELEQAFSEKTKLVVFNNPHNPSGRVMDDLELETISSLVNQYDTYLLSDEVYEFLTFDQHEHHAIAKYPNMRDRVITISSIGKTFGLTGWKTGWAIASEQITRAIRMVHQNTTFCTHHPTQQAMAHALEQLEQYIPEFRQTYQQKRDHFIEGLRSCDLEPFTPEGTYFIMVPIHERTQLGAIDYSMQLIEKNQVATIPPTSFYLKSEDGQKYLRLCFAKEKETLDKAIDHLKR